MTSKFLFQANSWMMLTFVRESLWISKVMKIPKPVKFEIINKNVIFGIINLFKDQDIS